MSLVKMRERRPLGLVLASLAFGAACGNTTVGTNNGGGDDDAGDQSPPTIAVTQVEDGQPSYVDVVVMATVADEGEITEATLFYHNLTADHDSFQAVAMEGGGEGSYTATIPGDDVTSSRVYYYVQACDDGEPSNCASAPEDARQSDDYFAFNVE